MCITNLCKHCSGHTKGTLSTPAGKGLDCLSAWVGAFEEGRNSVVDQKDRVRQLALKQGSPKLQDTASTGAEVDQRGTRPKAGTPQSTGRPPFVHRRRVCVHCFKQRCDSHNSMGGGSYSMIDTAIAPRETAK